MKIFQSQFIGSRNYGPAQGAVRFWRNIFVQQTAGEPVSTQDYHNLWANWLHQEAYGGVAGEAGGWRYRSRCVNPSSPETAPQDVWTTLFVGQSFGVALPEALCIRCKVSGTVGGDRVHSSIWWGPTGTSFLQGWPSQGAFVSRVAVNHPLMSVRLQRLREGFGFTGEGEPWFRYLIWCPSRRAFATIDQAEVHPLICVRKSRMVRPGESADVQNNEWFLNQPWGWGGSKYDEP